MEYFRHVPVRIHFIDSTSLDQIDERMALACAIEKRNEMNDSLQHCASLFFVQYACRIRPHDKKTEGPEMEISSVY